MEQYGPVLKGYIVHVAPLAKPGYPLLEKAIGMCSIPGKHWSAGQMVNVVANLKSNEAIIQKTWNALSAKERKEIADAQAENLISLNAVAPYEVFVRQGEHWYKFKNWNDPLTIENLLHKLDK